MGTYIICPLLHCSYYDKFIIQGNENKKSVALVFKIEKNTSINKLVQILNNENIYEDAVFLDYNATLYNLEPDTEYMYKVGQNVLSDVQYFKTAGSTSFSFAWISDFHAYAPIPNRLKSAMNMIKTAKDALIVNVTDCNAVFRNQF